MSEINVAIDAGAELKRFAELESFVKSNDLFIQVQLVPIETKAGDSFKQQVVLYKKEIVFKGKWTKTAMSPGFQTMAELAAFVSNWIKLLEKHYTDLLAKY